MTLSRPVGAPAYSPCSLCMTSQPVFALHLFHISSRVENRRDWVYSCADCRRMVDRVVGHMMADDSSLVLHICEIPPIFSAATLS